MAKADKEGTKPASGKDARKNAKDAKVREDAPFDLSARIGTRAADEAAPPPPEPMPPPVLEPTPMVQRLDGPLPPRRPERPTYIGMDEAPAPMRKNKIASAPAAPAPAAPAPAASASAASTPSATAVPPVAMLPSASTMPDVSMPEPRSARDIVDKSMRAAPAPSTAIASARQSPVAGEIDVVVTPLPTPDDWHRFEIALRRVRGITQLRPEFYRHGVAKMRVVWEGEERLAHVLRGGMPGYRVRILGEDRSTLQILVSSDNDERRQG
jgi:hypothetical protein